MRISVVIGEGPIPNEIRIGLFASFVQGFDETIKSYFLLHFSSFDLVDQAHFRSLGQWHGLIRDERSAFENRQSGHNSILRRRQILSDPRLLPVVRH